MINAIFMVSYDVRSVSKISRKERIFHNPKKVVEMLPSRDKFKILNLT